MVVDLDDPLRPKTAAVVALKGARASALQFRYLFVTDDEGFKVIDVTTPEKARLVESARIGLADARRVYVARTYAYVAGGREGLVIVDVERPESPRVHLKFDDGGKQNDARDGVGHHELFVDRLCRGRGQRAEGPQLTSPEIQPKFYGFSPAEAARDRVARDGVARAVRSPRPDRDRAVERDGRRSRSSALRRAARSRARSSRMSTCGPTAASGV